MTAYDIVCQGLEEPIHEAFAEAMRPELQRRILEFSEADWDRLMQSWQERSPSWIHQLCDTLSPSKHGRPAIALLIAIALEGPNNSLDLAVEKLIASKGLNPAERSLLHTALAASDTSTLGHHEALRRSELLHNLAEPHHGPAINEASEYSTHHRDALRDSIVAACYYCQTVFPASQISEFTDGGRTALCPYCGTDAVLPSASGYDLSPAGLQALNEFWFL